MSGRHSLTRTQTFRAPDGLSLGSPCLPSVSSPSSSPSQLWNENTNLLAGVWGYHSLCQSFLVIVPPLSVGSTASSLLQSSLALTSLANLQGQHLVYEHEECWLVVRLSPDRTNVTVVPGCGSIDITITRWLPVKQSFQPVNRKR